jgi:hypothetical protein
MSEEELLAQAVDHESQARALRDQARDAHRSALRAQPLASRLVYAAVARCPCGAGLAYDPVSEGEGVFRGPSYWDCSAILTGEADPTVTHTGRLPFAFYEIKAEGQPSAYGQTTRPSDTKIRPIVTAE